jgi:2,5-furandicarboxylate decarboxylase 2
MTAPTRIIVGMSGASGALLTVRLLQALRRTQQVETHLVITASALLTASQELDLKRRDLEALADVSHNVRDLGASLASGSYLTAGMVIAPCSMKTLASVAIGLSDNLLTRAADVILKERRRLVLVARETPLNLAHLRNMVAVTEMGGIIMPPVPAFYAKPLTIDDVVDHTVGRILDLFGLSHSELQKRWTGMGDDSANDASEADSGDEWSNE